VSQRAKTQSRGATAAESPAWSAWRLIGFREILGICEGAKEDKSTNPASRRFCATCRPRPEGRATGHFRRLQGPCRRATNAAWCISTATSLATSFDLRPGTRDAVLVGFSVLLIFPLSVVFSSPHLTKKRRPSAINHPAWKKRTALLPNGFAHSLNPHVLRGLKIIHRR